MPPRQGAYGAGGSEEAGCVMEPRKEYSRGQQDTRRSRGERRRCAVRRKAAVLGARGRVRRTPPGSESGACLHRGNSGTWESQLSPCRPYPEWGTGCPKALAWSGGFDPATSPQGQHVRAAASQVSGRERQAKRPERGRMAVFAAHSPEEGGEPRPTGPPGGQATPGLTLCGTQDGSDRESTNRHPTTPAACGTGRPRSRWGLDDPAPPTGGGPSPC